VVKPANILFLMTDQHRWDALGVENPLIKTPNLDRLARSGIRYRQAVCNAPMCVPSRHSMMLGLYPSQCGVRHNTQFIPRDEELPAPTLAGRLRDLGYQTAGFGKTHWFLGERYSKAGTRVEPSTRGFEVKAQARPADVFTRQPGATVMEEDAPEFFQQHAGEVRAFGPGGENLAGYKGLTSQLPPGAHREAWLTEKTLDFLRTGRDPSRPLFLYVSFDFPHAGFNVPAEFEALYQLDDIAEPAEPPWQNLPDEHTHPDMRIPQWYDLTPEERRRSILRYYALCSYVDAQFGKILAALEETGEMENTNVLFTADHGEMLGERHGQFKKYCLYEASVRVPLIVAGPAVPPAQRGTIDERPAELVDVLPTLLDMAGSQPPQTFPGGSLLRGPVRPAAFAELHGTGYDLPPGIPPGEWRNHECIQMAPSYMWRSREWKLILHLPGPLADAAHRLDTVRGELYDLAQDPQEWRNLYDEPDQKDRREGMTRDLLLYLATVWARFPYGETRVQLRV
jgi:arylsulfatase A-like enzyme